MNGYKFLTLMFTFVQSFVFADDAIYTYEVKSSDEATVTGCLEKCPPSISIPDIIDGYTITSVGFEAFSNSEITSITLPASVSSIERGAFKQNNLTSIAFHHGLTHIGRSAFSQNKLEKVTIPKTVRVVSRDAFKYNRLKEVIILEGTETIGQNAFSNNQLLMLSLPDSLMKIEDMAFLNNQLKSVSIPKNVEAIGRHAFDQNPLVQAKIYNEAVKIGFHAFPDELSIQSNTTTKKPSPSSEKLDSEENDLDEYDAMLAALDGRYSEALEIYKKLSDISIDAKIQVAQMYENGQGTEINTPLAIQYYEQIAEKEGSFSHKAARIIGDLNFRGASDYAPNLVEALRWYERAAELGSIHAATKLSELYLDRDAEYFSVEKGIKYLKLNAERSHASSLVTLAMLYYKGEKVRKNHPMALELLLKASDLGSSYSRYVIGVLYSDGDGGVTDNVEEAFMWFIIASVTGYENAAGAIMQLKPHMTAIQIQRAQDEARRCAEYDYVGC